MPGFDIFERVETIAINLKERNFTKLVSQMGDVFVWRTFADKNN